MNIKDFYKKYINYIVLILIALIMFKGCQSCIYERQYEYYKIQTEQIIDS